MRLPTVGSKSKPWFLLSVFSASISGKQTNSLAPSFRPTSHGFSSRYKSVSKKMTPELIDVDCNLLHSDLKTLQKAVPNDPWNILNEDAIDAANIVAMLSPSSTITESQLGLELLKENPPPIHIRTTIGVHPYHVNEDSFSKDGDKITLDEHKKRLKTMLLKDKDENNPPIAVAIGECGLDASEGFPPLQDQIPWFQMQIEIAQELGLPLFVHERLAFQEAMELLKDVDTSKTPVIVHCFTGTKQECMAYIEQGFSISISGYILKESNSNHAEVVSCLEDGVIPLDCLMIETDAPYMGFEGCRKLYLEQNQEYASSLNAKKRKRLQQSIYPNVPSSLPMVLVKVTECLQKHDPSLTVEQVAEATTANARSFFRL